MNFCEKCCKIVPDDELSNILSTKIHVYKEIENAYQNKGTMRVGFLAVVKRRFCGIIREPTPEEYFIYHTLDVQR